jgi:hypothetical protein
MLPDRSFYGQCYQRSLRFVLDRLASDECVLVHGTLYAGGYDHAWVELPRGIVFDGVTQRFYGLAGYYSALGARRGKRYALKQAAAMMLLHKHAGPW